MKKRLLFGVIIASLVVVVVSYFFNALFALGVLIGSCVALCHYTLMVILFLGSKKTVFSRIGGVFLLSFVKLFIVAAGLLLAARIGKPAILGLFLGIAAALTGAAIAGLSGD